MKNYKEKYEQAMLRMDKWVQGSEIIDPREVAEFVFPEFKESEDERIKVQLLAFLDDVWHRGKCADFDNHTKSDCADWMSWVEKQHHDREWTLSEEKMLDDIFVALSLDSGISEEYKNKLISFLKTYRPYYQRELSDRRGMDELNKNIAYTLRQLTGCGLKTCYDAITELVNALKHAPATKMDVGYRIRITFEEHPLHNEAKE